MTGRWSRRLWLGCGKERVTQIGRCSRVLHFAALVFGYRAGSGCGSHQIPGGQRDQRVGSEDLFRNGCMRSLGPGKEALGSQSSFPRTSAMHTVVPEEIFRSDSLSFPPTRVLVTSASTASQMPVSTSVLSCRWIAKPPHRQGLKQLVAVILYTAFTLCVCQGFI